LAVPVHNAPYNFHRVVVVNHEKWARVTVDEDEEEEEEV
jgi:hypothetical protein